MLTYQEIVNSIPINFRDYIRSNDEWIALLNQAVRRACTNSRRFVELRTSAPIPLEISTYPLVRREEGLITYDRTYNVTNASDDDFSIATGIREWTNEVKFFDVEPLNWNNIKFRLTKSQFEDIDKGDEWTKRYGKDCTVLLMEEYGKHPEFVIGKFSSMLDAYTYEYTIIPAYVSPIKSAVLIDQYVYFGETTHSFDYYFVPQHTIDAIYSRELILDDNDDNDDNEANNADYELREHCLIDPILFNLVRLELKKSLYEYIEDTTSTGQATMDALNREINEEEKRVSKTLHSPISKLNSRISVYKPNDILLRS